MRQIKNLKIFTEILHSLQSGDVIFVDEKLVGLFSKINDNLSYRIPKAVDEYICYPASISGNTEIFDLCPKCDTPLSREYQKFCSACGQHLKWINPQKMTLIYPNHSDEESENN